ncbi:ubiquinone biosynthesis O-methyltransferase-like [Hydractinia symbiolongicarpus]|uniref:ubiquinone biosynthesis O-methyltransferase-like n=1 Tax=Hydractinia symbiolongicarpus TaxID=13093 RepID=UPI00254D2069|nr:ubiquinone biosynthesis O-methyltransferase-like [Hydractinia symbiolongicarpus]
MENSTRQHVVSEEDKKFILDYLERLYSVNTETMPQFYVDFASMYDKANAILKYEPFKGLAKDLAVFFEHKNLENKKILDVGCGNGNLGKSLVEEGFKNIDGLDMSDKFLEMAKETKCYGKLFKALLTANPTPGIEDNSYDVAMSTGCYIACHLSMDTIFELARIVKPGGYIHYTVSDPNDKMDFMYWQGKLMKEKKAELIYMKKEAYRLDPRNNFERVYCYYVMFKVL